MNTSAVNSELVGKASENRKENTLPVMQWRTVTAEGEEVSVGWFSTMRRDPEQGKLVPRETPAFQMKDFFVVDVDGSFRLFVLHTGMTAKQTMFEYHRDVENIQDARKIAMSCVTPGECFHPFFRVYTNEGMRLWKPNQTVILSTKEMEAAGLPPFMREEMVERVEGYRGDGSLFTLRDLASAPEACSNLRSTFGGE